LKFQASGLLDDDTGSRQYSEKTLILSGRYWWLSHWKTIRLERARSNRSPILYIVGSSCGIITSPFQSENDALQLPVRKWLSYIYKQILADAKGNVYSIRWIRFIPNLACHSNEWTLFEKNVSIYQKPSNNNEISHVIISTGLPMWIFLQRSSMYLETDTHPRLFPTKLQ
jgi:hypothetical protein